MTRVVTFFSLLLIILSVCVLSAWAKGPQDVTNGLHNLGVNGLNPKGGASPYASTNVTEVCVFCHTPHGGRTEGPLWNRNLPSATYTAHYSSYTLTLATAGGGWPSTRAIGDQSRLCLSCHDGTSALDQLINPPNEIGNSNVNVGETVIVPGVGGTQAGVIGNLTNDHPISFSYDDVHNQGIYGAGGARAGELHTVTEARTAGVRFFNSSLGTNMVECSSCHDPHVYYDYDFAPEYAPFLIMPNAGSNLCLACHNK